METQADIGLIGLAVMGQNLVLNMNDHGFTVAVFNRTVSKVDDFMADQAKGTKVIGTHTIEEFVAVWYSVKYCYWMTIKEDKITFIHPYKNNIKFSIKLLPIQIFCVILKISTFVI